jgi:NTE family protein
MNRSVTGESSNIAASLSPTRIGVALGGGFAQGLAHIGVLRAFERAGLPIHSVAGVSCGAIAAAAFASGCSSREIAAAARMLVSASAENLMSFAMGDFLRGLLKQTLFERMTIP